MRPLPRRAYGIDGGRRLKTKRIFCYSSLVHTHSHLHHKSFYDNLDDLHGTCMDYGTTPALALIFLILIQSIQRTSVSVH